MKLKTSTIFKNVLLYRYLFAFLCTLVAATAKGQAPIADFNANDTSICAPDIVSFRNTSFAPSGTTYSWDLGNTVFASTTDAATTYATVGTYTVTLTASNSSGSSTKKLVIRAYDKPNVDFSASPINSCVKAPITFTVLPISAGSWGGIDYTWNFGDGASSTSPIASYAYTIPGYYNITLLAKNAVGCISSKTKGTYIRVYAPVSIGLTASSNAFCSAPAVASFINTTIGAPPLSYQWEFGDGNTSGGTSPTNTYTVTGNYSVKVISTDGNGCMDSLILPNYIQVKNLTAGFSSVANGCMNVEIKLKDTGTTYHDSKVWDFGDGNSSMMDSGLNAYAAPGIYNAKLTVSDGTCSASVTHPITITGPVGNFSAFQPCTPENRKIFTATVSSGATVTWDYDAGKTFTGPVLTHTYTYPLFPLIDTVSMTMTDASGCINRVVKTDTINNLSIDFTEVRLPNGSRKLAECIPLQVNMKVLAIAKIGYPTTYNPLAIPYYRPINSYLWNFGDGTPTTTTAEPSHTYTAVGVYTVTCHITTTNGCSADSSFEVRAGSPQSASFTMDRSRQCNGVTVNFTSSTTSTLIDKYEWAFGDGITVVGPTVTSHAYHIPKGSIQPQLIVYYNGCMNDPIFQLWDTVDAPNSEPRFKFDCIPSNSISFGDSSVANDNPLWDFGDGTTSTLKNPVHLFPSLSLYTVNLFAHNNTTGCRDTNSFFINLARLQTTITPRDSFICRDKIDTFYSSTKNVFTIGLAPFTKPVAAYWYLNGIATDTTYPRFPCDDLAAGCGSTSRDTIDYLMTLRGDNNIMKICVSNHGCFDTATRMIRVAKPIARFNYSFTNGCAPVASSYTDISTDVPGMPLKEYYWNFGEGTANSITSTTTTHSYTTAGTFTVKEIVVDTLGCRDTVTGNLNLVVYKPTAEFSASDLTACLRNNIGFLNYSINSTSWLWMFGDGTTSTVYRPLHTYPAAGTYTVTLVAFDAFGCSDTITKDDYITINPVPVASFYMDDSFAVCPPLNVNFFNNSTGSVAFQWTLGDGNFSSVANPNNIYGASGYYKIKLVASNIYGCIDTAIGHASVFGFSGGFTYTPSSICKGDTVHFAAVIQGADQIAWDYNDGSVGFNFSDTTHVYTAPGKYIPRLILRDSSGCSNTNIGIDTIRVDTLVPNFSFTPATGCTNSPVTFKDSSYSYFSTPAQWLWSFGSGATSTVNTPAYTYSVAGIHTVSLYVTSAAGCRSNITKNITINSAPDAITGNTIVCKGQTSALSDTTAGGAWTTSNTIIASVATGVVSGINTGTANITYSLPNGCRTSTTATVSILPTAITGTSTACEGATTKLSDATSGGSWNSSNTLIATVDNTGLVSGIAAGTLTISYSLPSGCMATRTVTINPLPATITGSTYACKGQTTALSNTSAGGTWASGNITIATIGTGTGLLNGVNTGTAAITYRLGTGCITGTTITVQPSPTSITGAASLCEITTITLSNATAGGVWSSANTAIMAIDSNSGILTAVSAGTASISYSLTGTGCSANKIITVYPLPANITGPAFVCTGLSVALSSATPGGTWSSSNTATATITSSAIVSGISNGTSTITYRLSATGCYTTAAISVYPLPAPITGVKSVCAGAANTLSDASGGGTWSSSNTTIATIDAGSGIYNGITAGTAVVTYTLGSNSCIAMETVTVLVQPAAITGTTAACAGLTMSLTNATTGGAWNTSATTISVNTATGVVTAISAGTGTVTYNINGCTATQTTTVYALPAAITGIYDMCIGNTTLLSDTQVGGAWSSGSTGIATIKATGLVTGISGGTATITYAMPGGCATTQTVTVNMLPPAISGTMQVCIGNTTALTNVSLGGTWSSSNTLITTIGVASGIMAGISAGTATITYTSVYGCTITQSVTVNTLPAAIMGVNNTCIGFSSTLSNANAAGTWTTSNYIIAPVTYPTGIVTGNIAGTATITYTLPTGCATTIKFTVHPLPATITGPASVCAGSSVALSNMTPDGSWTASNTAIAAIDAVSGNITGVLPGTTTITYTLLTGCITTTNMAIKALPLAITGNTAVCAGATTTLSNATTGGLWTSSNTIVSVGLSTGNVTGTSIGTATITYTIYTGCKVYTTVTVDPLPPAISGNVNVCIGMTESLSNADAGGTWSSAATIVSINSLTGAYTGYAPGTALITYTLPTGCFMTTIVKANDTPAAITGTKNVCMGKTTSLANSLAGGTWASSDVTIATTDAAGGILGINAGTASITYTSPLGCATQTTVTVNALILPITGITSLCNGNTTMLSDAIAGGIWSSGNTDVATIGADGTVRATGPGTASITYSVSGVCGEATAVITVGRLPVAGEITGKTNFCKGTRVQLEATEKGGAWSSSNTLVATAYTDGGVVGLSAGTATISYTHTNACGTAMTTSTILVSETPEHARITTYPTNALCTDTRYQNFGTDVPPAAGVRYVWQAVNGEVYATGNNKQYCLVNFNTPGTSIIRLCADRPNTECMSYDSMTVNVDAAQAVQTSVVYYTSEFVCTDNTADSYQWGYDDRYSLDSTLLTGMVNQNYSEPTPDLTHRYYWVITDHKGCFQKTYYNTPTAVNNISEANIEILLFPNPAHDIINIEVKGVNRYDKTEAKLFDIMGRERKEIILKNGAATIPTNELVPGMYMIRFTNNGIDVGRKTFVKQ